MERLSSHWADFYEILYLSIFRKYEYIEKIKVSLRSDKNDGYFFMNTGVHF